MSAPHASPPPPASPPASTGTFSSLLTDTLMSAFQRAQGECGVLGDKLEEIFREQGAALARAEQVRHAAEAEVARLSEHLAATERHAVQLGETIQSFEREHVAYVKALQTSCAQFQAQEAQIAALTESNAALQARLVEHPRAEEAALAEVERLRGELDRVTRGYEAAHACIQDLEDQLQQLRTRPVPVERDGHAPPPGSQPLTERHYPGLNAILERAREFSVPGKAVETK